MRRIIMIAFIISIANKSVGQSNDDTFLFDYTLSPTTNDGIDFSKTQFKIAIPIKLKRGLFVNALYADFYQFNYTNDYSFSTTNLSRINGLGYGLKYIHSLSDTWKFNTQAHVSIVSNFSTKVSHNDLFFNGEVSVTGTMSKDTPETLTVGLNYSAITGMLRMLPMINYTKQVNDKFSYGIGFPNSFAEYKITDLSTLKSSLSVDGFYSNLSSPNYVNATDKASNVSFSSTTLTLEYHYKMDEYWGILFKGGYALSNSYKLVDSEDNTIFNFNTKPEPLFSAGIRFNLTTK